MQINVKPKPKTLFEVIEIEEPTIGDVLIVLDAFPGLTLVKNGGPDFGGITKLILGILNHNATFDGRKLRVDELEALGLDFLFSIFSASIDWPGLDLAAILGGKSFTSPLPQDGEGPK